MTWLCRWLKFLLSRDFLWCLGAPRPRGVLPGCCRTSGHLDSFVPAQWVSPLLQRSKTGQVDLLANFSPILFFLPSLLVDACEGPAGHAGGRTEALTAAVSEGNRTQQD